MYKSYTSSKERKKDPEPLFFRPAAGNTQNQMFDPEKRQEEEMARHFHMKNRKKYTRLYHLEKYFNKF
jgi:hypothetical protein